MDRTSAIKAFAGCLLLKSVTTAVRREGLGGCSGNIPACGDIRFVRAHLLSLGRELNAAGEGQNGAFRRAGLPFSRARGDRALAALIALVSLAPHLSVLTAGFTPTIAHYIVQNAELRTWQGLSVPSSTVCARRASRPGAPPHATLSYALDLQVFGPTGFHLTSLLLYGLCVAGVFSLALPFFRSRSPRSRVLPDCIGAFGGRRLAARSSSSRSRRAGCVTGFVGYARLAAIAATATPNARASARRDGLRLRRIARPASSFLWCSSAP